MNNSIKEMQTEIGDISKAISDLLNKFAARNDCYVDIEITYHDIHPKGGIIRSHNVNVKAVYGGKPR